MKILLSLFSLSVLLCISCSKQEITVYHAVSYSVTKPAGVQIDSILYRDANEQDLLIIDPPGRVYLLMKVKEGFRAELKVVGNLADSASSLISISHLNGSGSATLDEYVSGAGPFEVVLSKIIE